MTEREQLYSMDYSPITDAMEAEVVEDMVMAGGTVVDESLVEFRVPDSWVQQIIPEYRNSNVTICVYPEFLKYYDGGRWVLKVWMQCRLSLGLIPESVQKDSEALDFLADRAAEFLNENVIGKMKLKPFRDEDSFRGHFRKNMESDELKISFFVNPAYADGVWHNHTL